MTSCTDVGLTQVHLEPYQTIDCGLAALAAYADYDGQPVKLPQGFRCVARFTGWNQLFVITGTEERFGLVLQSYADPTHYLVAFRGTSSMLDAYEDIWINTVPFKPFATPHGFPKDVSVASGFESIYSYRGGNMAASMQGQLFALLDGLSPAPQRVDVTGHSLGSALANLFALDVAVSRPNLKVRNTTFASPRVGLATWKQVYDTAYSLKASTFRIANWWDIVPTLPPNALLGYEHVGQQFLMSFTMKGAWIPHYVSRHSMANYQAVVVQTVLRTPQLWVGEFPDAVPPHDTMLSEAPPSLEQPPWADMLVGMEQTAVAGS